MSNPLWNLDKTTTPPAEAPPTGSRLEQGRELIRRCDEREARLAERAIAAERDGDEECCWMAMAARAENKRVRDRIAGDVAEMERVEELKTAAESASSKALVALRERVKEIEKTTRCNCDLDRWQPEPDTGHSWVCRIHKAAKAGNL